MSFRSEGSAIIFIVVFKPTEIHSLKLTPQRIEYFKSLPHTSALGHFTKQPIGVANTTTSFEYIHIPVNIVQTV